MAKRDKEEREYTLLEVKAIIFKIVSDELDGYMEAKEKLKEVMAEMQRQRYSSTYRIVADCGWGEDFIAYRTMMQKEKNIAKK